MTAKYPPADWAELKSKHPEMLLLFRVGDFYELFHEDAEKAAKTLGLTLTYRNKGTENEAPMTGFPYHQLEGYLKKLIAAGFRMAMCENQNASKKLEEGRQEVAAEVDDPLAGLGLEY